MRLIPLIFLLACLVFVQATMKKPDQLMKPLVASKTNNNEIKNEELHINWTFLDIFKKKDNSAAEKKAAEKVAKDAVVVVKDFLEDASTKKTVNDTNKLLEDSLELLDKIESEKSVKQRLLAAKGRVRVR